MINWIKFMIVIIVDTVFGAGRCCFTVFYYVELAVPSAKVGNI